MKSGPRAAVACIVAALVSGRKVFSVYDRTVGKMLRVNGEITPEHINVQDYEQGCAITGTGKNGDYDLYHGGEGSSIRLQIKGSAFNGYDYASESHFNGEVAERAVYFHDYGKGDRFEYGF
jgi:hypothetical protein